MLDYARRIQHEEREANEYAWAETKMMEKIDALQAEIVLKRKELSHAQKHLHEHRKRSKSA